MNEFTYSDVKQSNSKSNGITFTEDQEKAVNIILDFIAKDFDPSKYVIGLCGAGGTGKTFITNYIIEHCKYSNSAIRCTSTTHKACRVFSSAINNKNVFTIQSTFGFRLDLKLEDFDPTNPQFNPMSSPKLENIKLLLIDEASMLPAGMVTYICKTCKNLGIKIIMIGDSFQLAPVNERKSIAFERCFTVCYLNQIVRQGESNPIVNLLDILRDDIKNKTYNFISYVSKHKGEDIYNELGEGFSICSRQEFKNVIDKSFSDEEYTKNIDMYRIVAYTNNCVAAWNNYIRNTTILNSDKSIITKHDLIMSYETIVDDFMSVIINNSEEYIVNDIVDFVDTKYEFKGFLVKFQLVHGGTITKPLFIIDHRDKYTILKYVKTITALITAAKSAGGGLRVSKWKEYYAFKKKYLLATNIISNGVISYSRDIDYGFAITSHKAQGSTYDNVFVDMTDMVYDSNNRIYTNQDDLLRRLYVACSRAKKKLIITFGT